MNFSFSMIIDKSSLCFKETTAEMMTLFIKIKKQIFSLKIFMQLIIFSLILLKAVCGFAEEIPGSENAGIQQERQTIRSERSLPLPQETSVKKYRIWLNFNLMIGGLSEYQFNGIKSDAVFVSNLKVGLRLGYFPWKGEKDKTSGFWQRGIALDIFYSSMSYKAQANSGTYLLSQQMHFGLLFMGIYKNFYIGGGSFINIDLGQTAYISGTEIPVNQFKMELKTKAQIGLSFVLGYMTPIFGKTITAFIGGRFEISLNKTLNEYSMDSGNPLLRTGFKQSSNQFSMLLEFGFGY